MKKIEKQKTGRFRLYNNIHWPKRTQFQRRLQIFDRTTSTPLKSICPKLWLDSFQRLLQQRRRVTHSLARIRFIDNIQQQQKNVHQLKHNRMQPVNMACFTSRCVINHNFTFFDSDYNIFSARFDEFPAVLSRVARFFVLDCWLRSVGSGVDTSLNRQFTCTCFRNGPY